MAVTYVIRWPVSARTAATLTTFLGISTFSPDLILSVGVAGGFRSKGAEVGTVYISKDTIRYFDRRVSIRTPNHHDYAIGYYPVADASQMALALDLPMGIVVTGNSFQNAPVDIAQIRRHDASVIEMEARGGCQSQSVDAGALSGR
jgi:5'-methylthioadenosine nucleosidase